MFPLRLLAVSLCLGQPIDFAGVVEAMGLKGYRAVLADDCGYMLDPALAQSGPALVEASSHRERCCSPKR